MLEEVIPRQVADVEHRFDKGEVVFPMAEGVAAGVGDVLAEAGDFWGRAGEEGCEV